MGKEYYSKARKAFYHSKAWQKTREAYRASRFGICERCGGAGVQVHHKTYLTDANLADPKVALCWDNLELLCDECHAKEHHAGKYQTDEGLMFDENGDLVQITPPVDENGASIKRTDGQNCCVPGTEKNAGG